MADDNQPPAPNPPPEATPPPAPPAPPPATPTPPSPPPPANPYGDLGAILKPIADGLSSVMNNLAGLPETIANAVAEKTGTPKPVPTPEGEGTPEEPAKRKSFADYWFSH
jgi:hypothetical protein